MHQNPVLHRRTIYLVVPKTCPVYHFHQNEPLLSLQVNSCSLELLECLPRVLLSLLVLKTQGAVFLVKALCVLAEVLHIVSFLLLIPLVIVPFQLASPELVPSEVHSLRLLPLEQLAPERVPQTPSKVDPLQSVPLGLVLLEPSLQCLALLLLV